jgi:glycosyltransferase involved in cell wall biosynthesis
MSAPPKVSVVIPCYNGGAFLPGALASLDGQSFRDFEIIIVDDGSDDLETLRVLDGLGAAMCLVRQENRGLAAARNAGMAAARGTYLLPLDCDDALEPSFMEKTVRALESRPDAAFAFSHLRLTGEKNGVLRKDFNLFTQRFLNQLPYCLLLRREAWMEAGGYDETMRLGYEDWEFNIRLGGRGCVGVVVPEPLFRYRVSGGGMLQSLSNRLHGQLWRDIRRRNPDLYGLRTLFDAWWRWRKAPAAYPAWALAGLLITHFLLPDLIFNRLFASLLGFSASARADAAGGT